EPPGDLRVEPPLLGGAGFEAISLPVIGPWWDGDAVLDFERRDQALAGRGNVELEPIAASESPVHGCREHAIAFPASRQIGRQRRLELEEHLLDRTMRQSRAAINRGVVQIDSRARHESE